MMNILKDFYQNVRNTMVWFVVYFILQAAIWVALAVLVLIYPQFLTILAAIFFFVIAVVSLYFGCVIIKYVRKLKNVKDMITGNLK